MLLAPYDGTGIQLFENHAISFSHGTKILS
jgi:hypothetical protein